jgi:hypothetical protein
MQKVILILMSILATFLFSKYYLDANHFYYLLWWLDIIMHMWGGFLFGLLYIYTQKFLQTTNNKKQKKLFYAKPNKTYFVLFIILIATLWEIYEVILFINTGTGWGGFPDTIYDYINAIIGSALAYFVCYNKDIKY